MKKLTKVTKLPKITTKTQLALALFVNSNTTYSAPLPPTIGMGRRVQEQPGSHRRGPDLRGAQEERHRVPHVRAGDPLSHTHTSTGKKCSVTRGGCWQESGDTTQGGSHVNILRYIAILL